MTSPITPYPNKITVHPDPLKQGESGMVCYQFDKDDPSPVTLKITWRSSVTAGESRRRRCSAHGTSRV